MKAKRTRGEAQAELVRVFFRSRGGDVESMWCKTVDAAAHLYRIDSIPFTRARPTYGDVIAATPDREGALTFRSVHEQGGFRSAALDYAHKATFKPLVAWLAATYGIAAEGCVGPRRTSPGILVLAVPKSVRVATAIESAILQFKGVANTADRSKKDASPKPAREPTLEDRLHEGIAKGDLHAVKKLVAMGAKLERRLGPAGDTAIIAAAKKKNLAVLKALLAVGAVPNAKNDFKQTAAYWAANHGDVKMLDVLHAAGADALTRDNRRVTGLQMAVVNGHAPMVKRLLALGADPNDRRNRFGGSPLGGAATRDRPKVAAILLAAGARTDLRNRDGFTPLMNAAYRGSASTARVLLANGVGKDLAEALLLAADEGYLPIVKMLVKAGADPAYRSPRGNTALSLARKEKRSDVVAYLVSLTSRVRETPRVMGI